MRNLATLNIVLILSMAIIVGGEEGRADRLTDEEIYENAVENPLTYVETIPTSKTGSTVGIITCSLSAISSLVLITIILRSSIGLKSLYHRIVFCMNLANICSSTAMGLATIPMPKDMIYTQFKAVSYGNTTTCTAQAAVGLIFSQAALMYFIALCIYHLLSIKYKMTEAMIRKKVEPWFHAIIAIIQSITLILCIDAKILNVSPNEQFCTVSFYPWYCDWYEEDCQLRDVKYSIAQATAFLVFAQYFLGAIIIFSSMFLIILTVYHQEKLINEYVSIVYDLRRGGGSGFSSSNETSLDDNPETNRNLSAARSRHHFTKVIAYQAMAYLLTITSFSFFIGVLYLFDGNSERVPSWITWFRLILKSSVGEICLIVFVGGKVYDACQVQRKLTIPKALFHVLTKRNKGNFIFSQISIIANGPYHNGNAREGLDFDVGGDEEEIEEGGRVYYPLVPLGQETSDIDGARRSTGINNAAAQDDVDENMEGVIDLSLADSFQDHSESRSTSEDQNGLSSFGPASWFSRSIRSSVGDLLSVDQSEVTNS